jgi:hypothetical protein
MSDIDFHLRIGFYMSLTRRLTVTDQLILMSVMRWRTLLQIVQ